MTGRFLPIAADYLVEDETGGACVNLTTSENFDYLYRSALRYADLMNVRLPFRARKGSGPRINITALYKALDETLPEHVNLEERAGRLHFCLYRFHDWPDIPCSGYPSISRRTFLYRYGVSSGNSYGGSYVTTG